MQEFGKIAIIKLSAIGDVVHALPVASALRRRYPKAHLAWIVEGKAKQVLEGHPDLDEIIVFEKARWLEELPYPHRTMTVLWEILRFAQGLRSAHFDLAIDLQGLIKSGVITWLTGAGIRLGFASDYCREAANTKFTNRRITPSPQDIHIIDQCLSLVRDLGVETEKKEFKLYISQEDHEYIEAFFRKKKIPVDKPIFLINPGAGWETKQWGKERYADLSDRIVRELGGVVIFLWGPSELPLVKSIQKKMKQPSHHSCPTTLKQSMALMQKARLFIAGDTGPLHMAAALNVPSLGLYGPSSPERNGPYGQINGIVQTDVACRNCFSKFCEINECMASISVDKVMQKVYQILNS